MNLSILSGDITMKFKVRLILRYLSSGELSKDSLHWFANRHSVFTSPREKVLALFGEDNNSI